MTTWHRGDPRASWRAGMHLSRVGALLAAGLSSALVLAGCGSTADGPDLGSGAVSAAGPHSTPGSATDGAPQHSATPTTAPSTGPTARRTVGHTVAPDAEPNRFAQRAGIPDRRYTDAAAELEIDDQRGAGHAVRVEQARLSRSDGFVAIFTRGGTLLGSAPVSRAVSPVTVHLDTRVPRSGELIGVLFVDNGDGHFDRSTDPAVNDGDNDLDDLLDLEDEDFDYVLT